MAEFCEHSAQSWSILDEEDHMYCDDCESIIVREPSGFWRPIGYLPKGPEKAPPILSPSETSSWPMEGQFWARLKPLALVQIKTVGEMATGEPGMFELHAWTPLKEEQILWVPPMNPAEFRFLWYSGMHRRGDLAVEPGDVLIVGGDRLLFIGPRTDGEWAHILADWQPPEAPEAKLYQPGPNRYRPKGRSVYDLLRNPEV